MRPLLRVCTSVRMSNRKLVSLGVMYHVRVLSHITFRRCFERTFWLTYAVIPA